MFILINQKLKMNYIFEEVNTSLTKYMKTEVLFGTLTVICLIGGINFFVQEYCLNNLFTKKKKQDDETDQEALTDMNEDNELPQTNGETCNSLEERICNLEKSFKDLSEKKEELLLLHEQLHNVKCVLESLKEKIPTYTTSNATFHIEQESID